MRKRYNQTKRYKIELTTINKVKKAGTKTVWLEDKVITEEITWEQFRNILSSMQSSIDQGGTETLIRSFTNNGYMPIRLTSTSPDKQKRTIKKFEYILLPYVPLRE